MNCASTGLQRMCRSRVVCSVSGSSMPDHVPQVEIAVGDLRDVAAADVAQIAFFALGHGKRSGCGLAAGEHGRLRLALDARSAYSIVSHSPSTSFMPYRPGGLPARNLAAASAPWA